jgi:hypothetical protein
MGAMERTSDHIMHHFIPGHQIVTNGPTTGNFNDTFMEEDIEGNIAVNKENYLSVDNVDKFDKLN